MPYGIGEINHQPHFFDHDITPVTWNCQVKPIFQSTEMIAKEWIDNVIGHTEKGYIHWWS